MQWIFDGKIESDALQQQKKSINNLENVIRQHAVNFISGRQQSEMRHRLAMLAIIHFNHARELMKAFQQHEEFYCPFQKLRISRRLQKEASSIPKGVFLTNFFN